MLETQIFTELFGLLPASLTYSGSPVTINKYRADQTLKTISYPALFISFLDPVVDATHTPLNKVLSIALKEVEGEEEEMIAYTKGIVVQQSIDLNLLDTNIKRIAQFEKDLWLWLNQNLALTGVTIFTIYPPRNLDFVEVDYVHKRNIEVVCKYAMSWEEIVTSIEAVEFTVEEAE